MVDVIPLARVVGERFRAIRSKNGIPLERIAAEARQLGLGWGKSSVAALEAGRRDLNVGELLLLPELLRRADAWAYEYQPFPEPDRTVEQVQTGRHPVGLDDLLPDDERPILLAGTVHTSARALREHFTMTRGARLVVEGMKASVGKATSDLALRLPRLWGQTIMESIRGHRAKLVPPDPEWHPDHDETFWPNLGQEAADDATRKAAAVLKVSPIAVALAAHARWNGVWGLTAEREHRLAGLLPDLQRDTAPRRKLQALRGHLTRQLLEELRPLLKDVPKKRRGKK